MKRYLLATTVFEERGLFSNYSTVISDSEDSAKRLYINFHNGVIPSQVKVICKY